MLISNRISSAWRTLFLATSLAAGAASCVTAAEPPKGSDCRHASLHQLNRSRTPQPDAKTALGLKAFAAS